MAATPTLGFKLAVDGSAVAPGTQQAGSAFQQLGQTASAAVKSVSDALLNLGKSSTSTFNGVASGLAGSGASAGLTQMQSKVSSLGVSLDQLNGVKATKSIQDLGKSNTLTAYQSQQLSFQLNDLFVQLASGQAPITALIQQGSQLSGTFGGIGGVFKALGTFITPVNVALAAGAALVGGAALAYSQGSAEAQGYGRALALTGNTAGVTTGQMAQMAQGIDKVVGTQAGAAAALTAIAGSGKVAGTNFQAFAQHAVESERTIGRSVADTVAIFTELGNAPVKASLKLNETTNYLTASVYQQIKALEDLGRKDEAASVAQKAYADAEAARLKTVEAGLGTLEKSWRGIKSIAAEAWDSMLGIGRQSSPEAELQKTIATVKALQAAFDKRAAAGQGTGDIKPQLDAARENLAVQQETVRLGQRAAQAAADNAARKKAELDLSVALEASETRRTKYATELKAANDLADRAGASKEQRTQLLAQVEEKYKDITAKSVDAQIEAIRRGELAKEEIIKRSVIEVQAQRKIGNISELELIERTNQATLDSLAVKRAAVEQELALSRTKKDNATQIASLAGQLAQIDAEAITAKLKGEADILVALEARKRAIQDVIAAQLQEHQDDSVKADTDALNRQNAMFTSVNEYVRVIQEANQQIVLEASLLGQTQRARDIALGQFKVELDLKREIRRIEASGATAAEQEIAIAKARAAAEAGNAGVVVKAQLDETTRMWESLDQTAHQVWTNITSGGQDVWSKLKNTAKSVFFDWLYQQAKKQFILQFGASFTGTDTAASLVNSASGVGNLGSSLNVGSMGGGMSWLTDFGGGVASNVSKAGNWLSSSTNTSISEFGSSLMDNASKIGEWSQSIGNGISYVNAAVAASKGQWGNAIGTAVGTYFGGPIGGAIGSTVGSWVDSIAKGGEQRSGASYSVNKADGTAYVTQGPSGGEISADNIRASIASTYAGINAMLQKLGSSDRISDYYAGLESSKNGKAFAAAGGTLTSGAEFGEVGRHAVTYSGNMDDSQAAAAELVDMKRSALEAYQVAAGIPQSLKDALVGKDIELMSDPQVTALHAQIEAIANFQDFLKSTPFDALKNISFDDTNSLLGKAGGSDALGSKLSSYYTNYYSDAEKAAQATSNIGTALAAVGLQMPATQEDFRKLVDQQMALGAAGQPALVALLNVEDGFHTLTAAGTQLADLQKAGADKQIALMRAQGNEEGALAAERAAAQKGLTGAALAQELANEATDDAIKAAEKAAQAQKDLDTLKTKGSDLEVQLLRAQGDEEGALALERRNALVGLTDLQIAQKKANDAIEDQIKKAQKEAKDAADLAALKSQAVDLTVQYLRAQGREEEALDLERKNSLIGLTALEVAQKKVNFATEDQIKLAQKAAQVAEQRKSVENALLQAIGDTAAIRRDELAALDPTNRALQTLTYNVNDAKTALDEANSKAEAIASERDGLQQRAWELTGNTTAAQAAQVAGMNEVNRSIGTYVNALEAAKTANDEAAAKYKAISDQRSSLEDEFYQLTGNTAAARTKELQALDPATRSLKEYLYALQDAQKAQNDAKEAVKTSANSAYSVLENAVSAQRQVLDKTIASLQQVFDTLGSNVKELLGTVDSTASASAQKGRNFISAALATAQAGGGMPDSQALQEAIAAARSDLKTGNFDSQYAYDRASLELAGELQQLQDIAGPQLTAAQAQAKTLDDMLVAAKRQVDAINGNSVEVKTVAEAQKAFNEAALLASTSNTTATTAATDTMTLLVAQTTEAFAGAKAKADAEEAIRLAQYTATQTSIVASLTTAFAQSQAQTTRIVTDAQAAYNAALAAAVAALKGIATTSTTTGGTGTTGGSTGTSNGGYTVGGTSGNRVYNVDDYVPTSGGRFGPLNALGIPSYQVANVSVLQNVRDFWKANEGDVALLTSTAQSYGLHTEDLAAAFGYSTTDMVSFLKTKGIDRFEDGGDHGGGWRLVGERGPELEATGPARYFNASQTASILGGGGGDTSRLESIIAGLRADMRAQTLASVGMQSRFTRIVEQWDQIGMPAVRT